MIKGGGGALTREKIVSAVARKFICIADQSKLVDILGTFPLPVEVIPMARSYVAREITLLGGHPALRQDFVTDNGNVILDVHVCRFLIRLSWRRRIKLQVSSPMDCLLAKCGILLLGTDKGVETITV